ncbi:MAG TPA: hypothetical protein VEX18_07410, partial [Polyangiaceae bacterium]|nr:hypothetical protein [Polyangiaceae bacterium]
FACSCARLERACSRAYSLSKFSRRVETMRSWFRVRAVKMRRAAASDLSVLPEAAHRRASGVSESLSP